ncbi:MULTISPECIES: ABC transporter ATP-binding protein [unclassified Nonomuraea]|uniref:ABC transporter ATP-binding protein n=1 Tax=unclassified Nonomuraea TaxID=2593643 RepID=UPI0034073740
MNQPQPTFPVVFDDVTKAFARKGPTGGKEQLVVCRDLSFHVAPQERVAIVGATGSGKSTALSLMMGLQSVTSGRVRVLGHDPYRDFDELRAKVGIIFQTARLLPWRTTIDNVALGLQILGVGKKERKERAAEWLDKLGLGKFAHVHPHELSGGMQQRAAIARTFLTDPDLILADEAFSALDEVTAAAVRSDLLKLIQDTRKTTVFVTHSISEAVEVGQRVLVLAAPGRVVGTVELSEFGEPSAEARHTAERRVREILRAASTDGREAGNSAIRTLAKEASTIEDVVSR